MTKKNDILLHFAMERWRDSEASTDRLHTKCVALATLALALTAATYSLLDVSVISELFERVDVFIYYLSAALSVFASIVVWCFVAAAMLPRSEYMNVAPVSRFAKKFESKEWTADELIAAIVEKVGDCELVNREIDQRRMRQLKHAFHFALICATAVCLCGLFRDILAAGGVL
ncbi:MAG: hypothetical protein CMJ35_04860 [Phycisphaerae bacterium]|nr:hypothetical protein [Phycisphaerae bacterium]MBM90931.1 hypothetical protein [Phycisphaerae bacterium]HCT46074.1 hypothetical protein [Phycisphaerales bacterium]|tara:strand:+ start:227 stop:745 length:519 start_codon:yes stop_codon:yes gene_type:complete